MSPPTFYNHFKDKYDVIVWIYVRDVEPIISQIGKGNPGWMDILREAAHYYWKNKEFVVNALKHTGGHDAFLFQVQKINTEPMTAAVRKRLMTEHLSTEISGEEGADKFDKNIRYCGSLQNYLIDTGDEVILVDTGLPADTPEEAVDDNSIL